MNEGGSIPLTLITGFLGSGKTTIIKKLLQRKELSKTAVIINEFGEIGLDHHFIETSDCLLYTSPSPRDRQKSRMPSSA